MIDGELLNFRQAFRGQENSRNENSSKEPEPLPATHGMKRLGQLNFELLFQRVAFSNGESMPYSAWKCWTGFGHSRAMSEFGA
jgi:hypothetical protein